MSIADYITAAKAAANSQGLTAEQVEDLTYAQLATLAGVTLGKTGESPADFVPGAVRVVLARQLAADEREAWQGRIQTKLAALAVTSEDEDIKQLQLQSVDGELKLDTAKKVTAAPISKEVARG